MLQGGAAMMALAALPHIAQPKELHTTHKDDSVEPQRSEQKDDKIAIRPFPKVNVPETELTELRRRINATRWPERETVMDATQGVQLATTQALASYWAKDYDWRKEVGARRTGGFSLAIDGIVIR